MPKEDKEVRLTSEQVSMYIANCVCCSLAKAMMTCPTCPFNLGLEARAAKMAELQQIANKI